MSNTISELFSPGSPNKLLLDTLHTIYALLMTLFGIGLLQFARSREQPRAAGIIGAILFILMGMVSVTTATLFPQDPWGSPATIAGKLHEILHGVISILTMFSMLSFGIWFRQTKLFPGFLIYSLITVGAAILSAGFLILTLGSPIMGLTERIAALVGFQWTFTLAFWLFTRKEPIPI